MSFEAFKQISNLILIIQKSLTFSRFTQCYAVTLLKIHDQQQRLVIINVMP